jgi:hypothetical protein
MEFCWVEGAELECMGEICCFLHELKKVLADSAYVFVFSFWTSTASLNDRSQQCMESMSIFTICSRVPWVNRRLNWCGIVKGSAMYF